MPDTSRLFSWLGEDSTPFDIKSVYPNTPLKGMVLKFNKYTYSGVSYINGIRQDPVSEQVRDVPIIGKVVVGPENFTRPSVTPMPRWRCAVNVRDADGNFSDELRIIDDITSSSIDLNYLKELLDLDGTTEDELIRKIIPIFDRLRVRDWVDKKWQEGDLQDFTHRLGPIVNGRKIDTDAIRHALKPPPIGLCLRVKKSGFMSNFDASYPEPVYIGYVTSSELIQRFEEGRFYFEGIMRVISDPQDKVEITSFNSSTDYIYLDDEYEGSPIVHEIEPTEPPAAANTPEQGHPQQDNPFYLDLLNRIWDRAVKQATGIDIPTSLSDIDRYISVSMRIPSLRRMRNVRGDDLRNKSNEFKILWAFYDYGVPIDMYGNWPDIFVENQDGARYYMDVPQNYQNTGGILFLNDQIPELGRPDDIKPIGTLSQQTGGSRKKTKRKRAKRRSSKRRSSKRRYSKKRSYEKGFKKRMNRKRRSKQNKNKLH